MIISLKEEVFLQENNSSVSTCAMFFQKGTQLFINKAGSFQRQIPEEICRFLCNNASLYKRCPFKTCIFLQWVQYSSRAVLYVQNTSAKYETWIEPMQCKIQKCRQHSADFLFVFEVFLWKIQLSVKDVQCLRHTVFIWEMRCFSNSTGSKFQVFPAKTWNSFWHIICYSVDNCNA